MTNVKTHIDLLLSKYNLSVQYSKFKLISLLNALFKESLYWILLYFSSLLKTNPDKVKLYSTILIAMFLINIPLETFTASIRDDLIIKLDSVNDSYYIDNLILCSKESVLKMDLVRYFNSLELLNENVKRYIMNIQIRIELPINFSTLLVISFNQDLEKKNIILVVVFVIFYLLVGHVNNKKIKKEVVMTDKNVSYQDDICNYIINSKELIVNNMFNKEYINHIFNQYNKSNKDILDINSSLITQTNSLVFITMLVPILYQFRNLDAYNFISYFLIFYDIELISNKMKDYYYNKSKYDMMDIHLDFLNQVFTHPIEDKFVPNNESTDITIDFLSNETPYIKSSKPIIIKQSDHVLIDGLSGSGKTSLLYFLKGIVTFDSFRITPDILSINQTCFITLPNIKSLYSGSLYNVITNYQTNPNPEQILIAMKLANLDIYITNPISDRYIEVDKISAGEYTRFLIARIVYMISFQNTQEYSILLFDEIDSNLNDDMAILICKKLLDIFSNKTILYITHNIKIKDLFKKKIMIVDGNIL